MPLQLTLLSKF